MRYQFQAWWVSLAVALLAVVVTAVAPPRVAGAVQQQFRQEWGTVVAVQRCAKEAGGLVCDVHTAHGQRPRTLRTDVTQWPGHMLAVGDVLSLQVQEMADRYRSWRCKGEDCQPQPLCLKQRACAKALQP